MFDVPTSIVTTKTLGTTFMFEGMFENPDGTPYFLDKDFLGNSRDLAKPTPGPFENVKSSLGRFKIW